MPKTAVSRPSGNGPAIGRSVNTACADGTGILVARPCSAVAASTWRVLSCPNSTMPPLYVAQPWYQQNMSWQERLRDLGERLVSGEITTAQYRTESEGILAEADGEAAADTQPSPQEKTPREKVPIPVSAAWEA